MELILEKLQARVKLILEANQLKRVVGQISFDPQLLATPAVELLVKELFEHVKALAIQQSLDLEKQRLVKLDTLLPEIERFRDSSASLYKIESGDEVLIAIKFNKKELSNG